MPENACRVYKKGTTDEHFIERRRTAAVSYTHLDVYKRQVPISSPLITFFKLPTVSISNTTIGRLFSLVSFGVSVINLN